MPIRTRTGLAAIAAGACLALLAGCSSAPIPVAKNFEYTSQHKVRSAGHWDLLSNDVISQTLATLDKVGVARTTAVYVNLPAHAAAFDKGFREFLITKLVQSGVTVVEAPQAAELQVTYNSQVVIHKSERPHFIPGKYTMLAGGLMAIRGMKDSHLDAIIAATLGATGAADFASSINSGGPTHTEVILTTSVQRGSQYLSRATDVYYLEDVDAPLFLRAAPYTTTNLKVVGP